MDTQLLRVSPDIGHEELVNSPAVIKAAGVLKSGGLCALPTETVYGLAANGLNAAAVKKIYAAKGRPADNPLILHIADMSGLTALVSRIPPAALRLCDAFWPGPLTLVLPRSPLVPDIVSGGLSTVAVRMPSHPVTRAVITACGFPLAAPSANRSGSPSPTEALHVMADLNGKTDMILDGGRCECGVESTVVCFEEDTPVVLRPGCVTLEQLRELYPATGLDPGALSKPDMASAPASPGMKYRHYAPHARLVLLCEENTNFIDYVNSQAQNGAGALCFDEDIPLLRVPCVSLGSRYDIPAQARRLFSALRELDERKILLAYARLPEKSGVGLALYNRMLRAAAFETVII